MNTSLLYWIISRQQRILLSSSSPGNSGSFSLLRHRQAIEDPSFFFIICRQQRIHLSSYWWTGNRNTSHTSLLLNHLQTTGDPFLLSIKPGNWWSFPLHHRLNMEVDLQSLFRLHVTWILHSCNHWLSPWNSPLPPCIWTMLVRNAPYPFSSCRSKHP